VANKVGSVGRVCCVEVSCLETDKIRFALDKSWVHLFCLLLIIRCFISSPTVI
jgi:hypothetical protein